MNALLSKLVSLVKPRKLLIHASKHFMALVKVLKMLKYLVKASFK